MLRFTHVQITINYIVKYCKSIDRPNTEFWEHLNIFFPKGWHLPAALENKVWIIFTSHPFLEWPCGLPFCLGYYICNYKRPKSALLMDLVLSSVVCLRQCGGTESLLFLSSWILVKNCAVHKTYNRYRNI